MDLLSSIFIFPKNWHVWKQVIMGFKIVVSKGMILDEVVLFYRFILKVIFLYGNFFSYLILVWMLFVLDWSIWNCIVSR